MNVGVGQQVSANVVDGMGGVMNEEHLEVRVMGQQTSVENVVLLVANEIVEEEEVQVGENVGETSKGDVDQVEMDLERTILMIIDQENVVHVVPLLEQENANEDVEPHAHIDGGDIAIELHLL
jgi:hypothetical protein